MIRCLAALALALALFPAPAAERTLDFSRMTPGAPLTDFRAALNGSGSPPDWRLIRTEVPSGFPALGDGPPEVSHQTVLAQLSEDPTDERFPLLIYEPDVFADFTATLRFRTVSGRVARMAGLAFRLQDENNFYILRASSLGNTLRFYKVVDGVRSDPIGPEVRIPAGAWHTLEVRCRGNTIQCLFNGEEVIPLLNDSSFSQGRLALWTKSDSVSHFSSLRIEYDIVRTLPRRLVEGAMQRYPRLLGIVVYARQDGTVAPVAASDPDLLQRPATDSEIQAIEAGQIAVGTASSHAAAVFPLRDRNGDPLFAVHLRMSTFKGQTQNNVAARGRIVVDYLDTLVRSADRSER
ncbi:MAG: DUF1080 domain-containing protein [Verrucomicrobiae bacterium]|nr:DUF1080 domain-containing protein [Verrucomicrobiae bacterium]